MQINIQLKKSSEEIELFSFLEEDNQKKGSKNWIFKNILTMHPDFIKLKQAIKAQQITEPKRIRNFASDLVSEVSTRELLYIAIDKGILLAFMEESNPDNFFVNRMKIKLVQDYHINEIAAGKAIEYCLFLVDKNLDSNKSSSAQLLEINQNEGNFTDSRDGNIYKWVRIGTQVWMAENLNYETSNSWCYNNNPSNCQIYGRLYTYDAALHACPAGWHLPSDDEWETLALYVNSKKGPFQKSHYNWEGMGTYLKATTGWNKNGNGNDYFGFAGLPGSMRFSDGTYGSLGNGASFWSSSPYVDNLACGRSLWWENTRLNRECYYYRANGFSVRCVRD